MNSRAIGKSLEFGESLRGFPSKIGLPNLFRKRKHPLYHHADIFPGLVVDDYMQEGVLDSSWLPLLPDCNLGTKKKPGQFDLATIIGVECTRIDRSFRAIQDQGYPMDRLIAGIAIGKKAVDMIVPVNKFARLETLEGSIATVAVGQVPTDEIGSVTVGLLDQEDRLFQIPDAYILEQNVPTDEISTRFGKTPLV